MTDKWSKKFDKCVKCGTTERRHRAFGLCRYCFEQEKRKILRGETSLCSPMPEGKWSKEYDRCQDCGCTDRKHAGKGLCSPCRGRAQKRARGLKKVYKREHEIQNGIEKKYCSRCNQWKELDRFVKCHRTSDGLYNYCTTCKSRYDRKHTKNIVQHRQHTQKVQRERSDQRKRELIKKHNGCLICGLFYENMRVYDLHHLDRNSKEYGVSQKMKRANNDWKEEAQKCVIICANCHRLVEDIGIIQAKEIASKALEERYENWISGS